MLNPPLLKIYETSFRENFMLPCLSDYNTGETITYGEFARRIARLHMFFDKTGIRPGDRVALLGKNNINWVTVFMATLTYGAAIVPILNEFNPRDCQHIINHSGSRLLFISDAIWESVDFTELPDVQAALSTDSRTVLADRSQGEAVSKALHNLTRAFKRRYKEGYNPVDIVYPEIADDRMAILNYTSGTTGFSKGVILPMRVLWGNVTFGLKTKLHYKGSRCLSFLPLAHAYGCAFDMLTPLGAGSHITLLGRTPTPMVLMKAFADVRPNLIVTVPLILEKIYRKMIVPALAKRGLRMALSIPLMDKAVYRAIRRKLIRALGGAFSQVIVGGAALNPEVEDFLLRIKFPVTCGYGMTECGPLISITMADRFIPGSVGRVLPGLMEVKILSDNPQTPGEIMVRGVNVMDGYFRNPDATLAVLEEDGWLHTGDMGTLGGPEGETIFIKGRCKTMILSASGQNIYPEEIEAKLNNMPYVGESLVLDRDGKIIALVYADSEAADRDGVSDARMPVIMETTRKELNKLLAPYEQVAKIQLVDSEFEKTPKRSIKRFMYT